MARQHRLPGRTQWNAWGQASELANKASKLWWLPGFAVAGGQDQGVADASHETSTAWQQAILAMTA